MRYALRLVRTSRPKAPDAPELVKKYVSFGASVRAAQYLILGAKAKALTDGRYHVSFDDVKAHGASGAATPRAHEFPRGVRGRHDRHARGRVAENGGRSPFGNVTDRAPTTLG